MDRKASKDCKDYILHWIETLGTTVVKIKMRHVELLGWIIIHPKTWTFLTFVLSLIFLGMSTNNFYPYKWVKEALGEWEFARATKHDKGGYAYVIWVGPVDNIGVLTDCRHRVLRLEKHWQVNQKLYKSLQIHKKRGGRIDWSLALKDVLF